MKGKAELGKKNRAIIIAELLENPTTFSQLKQKLGFSAKTLTLHLRALENEGLVKREIHGRFVLYTVNKPETVLELRKQFYSQLLDLHVIYGSVLNEKTSIPLQESLKALKESIEKPEKEAETTKAMVKTIEIPEGFKKRTIRQKITNLYEKPEFEETTQPKPEFKIRKRHSNLSKKE
jgi:DNA-binding transcriptional ArsR family regulator